MLDRPSREPKTPHDPYAWVDVGERWVKAGLAYGARGGTGDVLDLPARVLSPRGADP
jgi:hypothetical protein